MREAFPWDTVPRYLLRDRDRIFGQEFGKQVKAMGIQQVLSAPRSPCLDHVIVFNERSLHRHLQAFVDYYHRNRVHGCPSRKLRRVGFLCAAQTAEANAKLVWVPWRPV